MTITRISFHYQYASAAMIGVIFLGVKHCHGVMPLSIFKVRIIKVISVRKSSRAEQFNVLLTEPG